jgi:hypothetical protein
LTLTMTVLVTASALPSVTNVATVSTAGDVDSSNDDDAIVNSVLTAPAPAPLLGPLGVGIALILFGGVAARRLRRRSAG